MTEDIRAELRAILARELGTSRTYLSNMLNGQRGQLSPVWQKRLDHLSLELTIRDSRKIPERER